MPADYDFATPPDARPPARTALEQSWSRKIQTEPDNAWAAETLVNPRDLAKMQERFDQLAEQRDTRPVRLRE
jgi:hypothetical protein